MTVWSVSVASGLVSRQLQWLSIGAHTLLFFRVHPVLCLLPVEVPVNEFSNIVGELAETPGHYVRSDISSGLQKSLAIHWELGGVLPLVVRIIVELHKTPNQED